MNIKKIIIYATIFIILINFSSIQGLENISTNFNQKKIKLNSRLNENTTMFYGTIYDNYTKKTIPDATIIALYPISDYNFNFSKTTTNSCGYYNISIPNDHAVFIFSRAENYFISYNEYNEGETPKQDTLLNFVLPPGRPIENSKIKGYIKNNYTNQPIKNVKILKTVSFYNNTKFDVNYTISNQDGYYEISTNNDINLIRPMIKGYYPDYSYILINNSDILWNNFSIKPLPIINSIVKGFIKDQKDNQPIIGARVLVKSENAYGDEYTDSTSTDANGYYTQKISAGNITIQINHPNYNEKILESFYIYENETLYINTTLQPKITYKEYNYSWLKNGYENEIINNAFVSKDIDYIDTILINSPSGSILTNVEFEISWEDDNIYGFFRTKGQDILTTTITSETGDSKTDSSIGGGNITFYFSINSIPTPDTILSENLDDAIDILEDMIEGENKALFTFETEIEIGEKIFRLIKYLKDQGNNFSLKTKFTYYTYEFEID